LFKFSIALEGNKIITHRVLRSWLCRMNAGAWGVLCEYILFMRSIQTRHHWIYKPSFFEAKRMKNGIKIFDRYFVTVELFEKFHLAFRFLF
jgi:hypothetical protein